MGIRIELSLRLPNSPGAAGTVCRLLAGERVNILAMTLDAGGHLHLIVDNHLRAASILRENHRSVTERDVIYVPVAPGPGGLAPILDLLSAAGINVNYAYGAASRDDVAVVIGVDDAQRAAAVTGL
jgi:hypothetical protein